MFTIIVLLIAAFVFALCCVGAMIVTVSAASNWPGRLFSYLMWMIVVASVGTIVLSGRVIKMEQQGLVVGLESEVGGTILAKLLLAAIIGISVALCAAWMLIPRKSKARNNSFDRRGLHSPNDIVIAFMIFYVAFSILPFVFGDSHYFHVSLVYPFFVFLALFLWVRMSSGDPVDVVKQCLTVVVLVSLVAAVVVPSLVVQPGYIGLIPGFTTRLWGVTGHANAMGAIACALLTLEAAEPSAKVWIKRCILAAASLALILAQSKTSIVAASFGLLIILSWRLLSNVSAKARVNRTNQAYALSILIVAFSAFLTIGGAWLMFSDTSLLASLERQLEARAVDDLATGTGRTFIWERAIQGGMASPLFGQGPEFWHLENRLRWGLSAAAHAHNLFLQVFSVSGFIGLTALLVFLYFFSRYSIRAAKVTRGGSLAMLAVFFIRSMTEVPIAPNSILGGESLAIMAYFIYAIDRGAKGFHETRAEPTWRNGFVKTAGIR
ncbi:O-antigen ligase [Nitrosospira multiformis]|uniref:O-antigen ligase n=1 Tax=Nitrosospira multiformis TaxID=1231 RepID=A0A1H8MC76_9PROT|nr:O-antigen ligase family protein [Nitrosospira multiformis]SEO14967.1 O-antigen ligase [Nitrosospira multiformis]